MLLKVCLCYIVSIAKNFEAHYRQKENLSVKFSVTEKSIGEMVGGKLYACRRKVCLKTVCQQNVCLWSVCLQISFTKTSVCEMSAGKNFIRVCQVVLRLSIAKTSSVKIHTVEIFFGIKPLGDVFIYLFIYLFIYFLYLHGEFKASAWLLRLLLGWNFFLTYTYTKIFANL